MSDYQSRKAERTAAYHRSHGVKMVTCGACAGSGYYDHNGSPPCGACNGGGKVRDEPATAIPPTSLGDWRTNLRRTEQIRHVRKAAGL
jgi:DnaJ-class molecular chaperone